VRASDERGPNAAPRKWKTAVTAFPTPVKGPVWVSSQLFTLEVVAPIITLTMERPAVEQGAQTQLFCKVVVTTPFEGKAKVNLIGLPAKTTTQMIEITKDTKEFAFPITADKTSPVGQHNVFAQVIIDRGGELITGSTGGTQLRIDVRFRRRSQWSRLADAPRRKTRRRRPRPPRRCQRSG